MSKTLDVNHRTGALSLPKDAPPSRPTSRGRLCNHDYHQTARPLHCIAHPLALAPSPPRPVAKVLMSAARPSSAAAAATQSSQEGELRNVAQWREGATDGRCDGGRETALTDHNEHSMNTIVARVSSSRLTHPLNKKWCRWISVAHSMSLATWQMRAMILPPPYAVLKEALFSNLFACLLRGA